MKYVPGVTDRGVILRPDRPGGKHHAHDGGGVREAILNRVGDTYYLFYDGARPGADDKSYWCACLAKSRDLTHWEKLGKALHASAEEHPESSEQVYQDFRSASSPWVYCEGGKWHMFYVGAQYCSPEGIPAVPYHTLPAVADSIEGPWRKVNGEPGREKTVCFYSRMDRWNSITSSPGHVLRNPKWRGEGDRENRKYLMFFSGCYHDPTYMRGIGIARADSLDTCDAYDAPNPTFWETDGKPILPLEHDLENASLYYEEANETWFLFANRVHENAYTNAIWVYWTKDLETWNEQDRAVVLDGTVSTWAHGAIGLATVVKADANTLALAYDGVEGTGTGHLGRCIGLAAVALPLDPASFRQRR